MMIFKDADPERTRRAPGGATHLERLVRTGLDTSADEQTEKLGS